MLTIRDETFDGTFPFAPYYHHSSGVELHYVDEGNGEPIVMLHGDPTWGYLEPVLLIWGMRDPVLPEPVLQMWQAQYPHATTCKIADAGHFLQEDDPNQIATQISTFIATS